MPQPKNKEFKALQDIWYKKLEEEGFQEIEQENGMLKKWHSHLWNRESDGSYFKAPYIEEYYRMAGYFLHEYKFEYEIDRKIWELHAEGMGMREIAVALKNTKDDLGKRRCINRDNVNDKIQALSKIMLEKYGAKNLTEMRRKA